MNLRGTTGLMHGRSATLGRLVAPASTMATWLHATGPPHFFRSLSLSASLPKTPNWPDLLSSPIIATSAHLDLQSIHPSI